MTDKKKDKEVEEEHITGDPRIDAIKEIIFGDNIKEYDEQFKKTRQYVEDIAAELSAKLTKQRESLEMLIDDIKNDIVGKLDDFKVDTTEQLKALEESKTDKKSLSSLLRELADKIEE